MTSKDSQDFAHLPKRLPDKINLRESETLDKTVLTTVNMHMISSLLEPAELLQSEDSPYPDLPDEVVTQDEVANKAAHEESDLAESLGITTE